jgi:osmotically-inducible protein OsmY
MEIEPMNKLSFIFALLAALNVAGCATSGGSSSDDSVTSTSSLSGGGRDAPQVSDSEITSSIQRAFSQDDLLSKANISVNSNQGVVSLSGRLSARAANRAVSVARAAPGVRRVLWASIEYIPE